MMAASSASEKGLDGDAAEPEPVVGDAWAGSVLTAGLLPGVVVPEEHPATASRAAATQPAQRRLFLPGTVPLHFATPRAAIAGLLCQHQR
ncbi:hypothetical protein [Arthrobacter sp. SLBN-112]|uniref:hypothetical protein n=1 Tax=Arthrobacter sp. SLBN-112 TaxID=2768452 RepID=UPI001F21B319|nr:hypothetical protein [Arthrobacter sp. SLBN-112]